MLSGTVLEDTIMLRTVLLKGSLVLEVDMAFG